MRVRFARTWSGRRRKSRKFLETDQPAEASGGRPESSLVVFNCLGVHLSAQDSSKN